MKTARESGSLAAVKSTVTPDSLRRKQLLTEMAQRSVDAMVAAPEFDFAFLTGLPAPSTERLTLCIISASRPSTLVIPALAASAYEHLGEDCQVVAWLDNEDPYPAVISHLAAATKSGGTIAVSASMASDVLLRLQALLHDRTYVSAGPILEGMRIVKAPTEVANLRESARLTDEALAELVRSGELRGTTERELAARLETILERVGLGVKGPIFLASGESTAVIGHRPDNRRIKDGDVVLIDFGGSYQNYLSDITRMICVGSPREDFVEIYSTVREAQERAFGVIAPGVEAQQVDRAARNHIERSGYGARFVHRVGHGIGLESHEPPFLTEGNEQPLAAGMIFTVEPGIYLPGAFGVRIEDMVLVTATGAEYLTHSDRNLPFVL